MIRVSGRLGSDDRNSSRELRFNSGKLFSNGDGVIAAAVQRSFLIAGILFESAEFLSEHCILFTYPYYRD